jgi:gamma-glutamyltranspeptidase/glutathione hydrolase
MKTPFTTRPEIAGTFGVVTSTHWIASSVDMAMLERGGNAFDAAVATGFALQIVEPHLNGPGGEVPIILWRNGEPAPRVICGQGTAPAAATISHFDALGLKLVPGTGLLAAVVPGAFDAWMSMLRDYGTMSLEDVLAPTIAYARNGYPIVERAVQAIYPVEDFFRAEWPTSAAVWLPGGKRPKPESLHRVPGIADTYERLCREAKAAGSDRVAQIEAARAAFYTGFVAEAIDSFFRRSELMDTSGRKHRGLLTGGDMAAWRSTYEEPVGYDYGGARLFKTGPWGQGPVLLQALAQLKGFDLAAMDPLGDAYVHAIAECMKLALADREAFYGDPNFSEVPLATLLRARLIPENIRNCAVSRCGA